MKQKLEIFALLSRAVNFREYLPGTPQYVYYHGIARKKRGKKHPSAFLFLGKEKVINPEAAFHLAKLMLADNDVMLLGKPLFRSQIDWGKEYIKHKNGPNAGVHFEPTSGIDECICAFCFYRDAPPLYNPKGECQMVGRSPQKFFGFTGVAKNVIMPCVINGKELGHYCPEWLSLDAE